MDDGHLRPKLGQKALLFSRLGLKSNHGPPWSCIAAAAARPTSVQATRSKTEQFQTSIDHIEKVLKVYNLNLSSDWPMVSQEAENSTWRRKRIAQNIVDSFIIKMVS